MTQVAFAPGLFTWPSDDPHLIAGRCADCESVTFPVPPSCARCGSTAIEELTLPRRGTLWTFTNQSFLPPQPYAGGETRETFEPFGVGLIEFPDLVRIESRLTESDPEKLRIGMEMELEVVPFRTDPDGTEIMTFAFAPVDETEG